ncbi:FadR/GntR family transcriptional regulator [Actinosynnema sp. NPDC047251]|uniref:Transcriptional regulator, GntR family n=1 Tax=Saccharothrix espanaensis (strain ATCC 51144 / DSM 44229 / JCM 9112 / NBRC 15066 / NRRL 15764) TaxID=1179773 RepID=K0K212_SACES|nr:FadR/GntR family transcriptional regulator [Saccharothrix espanaensis]CCH34285.1 Transcriptional regulator, GntR family [Saccharothrix espanaensis DSM 44229]
MPLATTRRAGLVDQVIDQMRDAIAGGEWPVGQRIPPEPELVTALGVGRNTVREAVRALSHAGLLEVRQGDGTFVRATSELSGAVRRLCGSELRDVLQVRRTLEVEGARLAAAQRTDDELRRLETLLAERDAALLDKDWERLVERDAAFHVLLVQCSHNTLLAELYQGLTEAVRASITATVETDHEDAHVSHTGLLDAVRDRDTARAAAEAGGFLEELLERHSK